jgi:hypothetical protein
MLKLTPMAGRRVAIAGAAMLMLAIPPAMAFAPSVAPGVAAGSQIDRVWWDSRGFWYPDNTRDIYNSQHPAQPRYHCWRPLRGPLICQWDYY